MMEFEGVACGVDAADGEAGALDGVGDVEADGEAFDKGGFAAAEVAGEFEDLTATQGTTQGAGEGFGFVYGFSDDFDHWWLFYNRLQPSGNLCIFLPLQGASRGFFLVRKTPVALRFDPYDPENTEIATSAIVLQ